MELFSPPKGISDIPCHQFSIKKQPYPYIALPWSLSKKKKKEHCTGVVENIVTL
jgi:hypothetical protein